MTLGPEDIEIGAIIKEIIIILTTSTLTAS